jgi:hypothetical protein
MRRRPHPPMVKVRKSSYLWTVEKVRLNALSEFRRPTTVLPTKLIGRVVTCTRTLHNSTTLIGLQPEVTTDRSISWVGMVYAIT